MVKHTRYTSPDVLMGIFAYLPEENRQFHYDNEEVSDFLYNQQKKHKVLEKFIFDSDGMYPHSEQLSFANDCLSIAGYLISYGLDYDPHEITKGLKPNFLEDKIKLFSPTEVKSLKLISKDFYKKFGVK